MWSQDHLKCIIWHLVLVGRPPTTLSVKALYVVALSFPGEKPHTDQTGGNDCAEKNNVYGIHAGSSLKREVVLFERRDNEYAGDLAGAVVSDPPQPLSCLMVEHRLTHQTAGQELVDLLQG